MLARQPIDLDRPHPFTAAGNTEFNCLLWMPPKEQRAGNIVLADSTKFTTAVRRHGQPENFWRKSRQMKRDAVRYVWPLDTLALCIRPETLLNS